MAKKSAKSKGYRKTAAKKAYLTKKEITITAVVAGVVIIALALFIALYDDGALNVSDGTVQTAGENSLIVNAGTGYNPRYYKLGQLAEIEGYTLVSVETGVDENVLGYIYTPDGDSPIDSISVAAYLQDAAVYAEGSAQSYESDSSMETSGVQTAKDDGHTVRYLTFRQKPIEGSESALVQALHGYVDVGENRMIYILVRNDAATADEYVDDAVLTDAMNQVLAALSYEAE